jgi:hypothetical protein
VQDSRVGLATAQQTHLRAERIPRWRSPIPTPGAPQAANTSTSARESRLALFRIATPGRDQALADSSFDIVSKIDRQEVDNALQQAAKEIGTRFDFRGVGASIAWSGQHAVEIRANSEERAKAVLDVFKDKLVKRKVSLKVLDADEPKLSGKEYRLAIGLKEGLSQDNTKKISKIIRDEGPSGVRAQIQGEELRVSSKKKDDLQAIISLLRGKDFDFALQFVNYR